MQHQHKRGKVRKKRHTTGRLEVTLEIQMFHVIKYRRLAADDWEDEHYVQILASRLEKMHYIQ